MNQNILFRIALDILVAFCVLFGWWYIALPIGLIALFKFSYYVEVIAAGFAYDALFGMGTVSSANIGFWAAYAGTLVATLCFAVTALIKKTIR